MLIAEVEELLAQDSEVTHERLCLQAGALREPLDAGRACIRQAIQLAQVDRAGAQRAARLGLLDLEGVPGAEALRVREELSRLWRVFGRPEAAGEEKILSDAERVAGPEPAAEPETKTCHKCGKRLPVEAFGKHGKSKDGLQSQCRACASERARESWLSRRQEANPVEKPKPAAAVPEEPKCAPEPAGADLRTRLIGQLRESLFSTATAGSPIDAARNSGRAMASAEMLAELGGIDVLGLAQIACEIAEYVSDWSD